MKRLRFMVLLPLYATLAACNAVVLRPAGDVAAQQRDLLVASTILMLLIIVPVMVVTVVFVWRYRASNHEARYEPDWDHSTQLELLIWSAPLLIIICLGALTWLGSHLLDPYRPLNRAAPGQAVPAGATPLIVDAVALDWKWLFIYPQYGIATVNELAAPLNRPIDFRITASSVMNSFYIPTLAGQIYAMPGMQTRLHAIINQPGDYQGFSANYSGSGFSGMHFVFHALAADGFDQWVAGVKSGGDDLSRSAYLVLQRPSENVPAHRYAKVDADLYHAILNLCLDPGQTCTDQLMHMNTPVTASTQDTLPAAAASAGPMSMSSMGSMNMGSMKMSAPASAPPADAPIHGAGLAPPTSVTAAAPMASWTGPVRGPSHY